MDEARIATQLEGLTPDERARVRGLVSEVVDCDRAIARAEGRKAALLAELAEIAHEDGARHDAPDGVEYARRAMAAEVAAATRIHPASAKNRMEQAERLTHDYPATHTALTAGRISKRHADVIADAGAGLDAGGRASLDSHAVPFAEARTPGELGKVAKVQAAELAPSSLRERHEKARQERRVVLTECEDGMSELWMLLPTLEARGIYDRATQMARAVRRDRRRARAAFPDAPVHGAAASPRVGDADFEEHECGPVAFGAGELGSGSRGDDAAGAATAGEAGRGVDDRDDDLAVAVTDLRSTDQLRADILADILFTAAPTGHELHASGSGEALESIDASVQITIPVSQILDPDAGTARVDEGGLVSPDTARGLAGRASGWDRLFFQPETGQVVAVDRYRPSEAQRRALVGRDVTCRFPGCMTPARRADIDHSHDYARGGTTDVSNLAHLCESHHMMKHHSGWGLRQLPDGVLEWTSPAGRVYTDEPLGRVFFQEAPDADRSVAPGWDMIEAVERRGAAVRASQALETERRAARDEADLRNGTRRRERADEVRDVHDERVAARMCALTAEDRRELAFAEAIAHGDITDPAAGWWQGIGDEVEVSGRRSA